MPRLAAFAAAALAAGCASAGPAPSPPPIEAASHARLGEEILLGGVLVRPLRIEEDSRCPASVQCVHAGTIRLAVRLGDAGRTRETVLRLGVPERLGNGRFLRLAAACPYPARPGPIAPQFYRFLLAAGTDPTPPPLLHSCPPA